MSEINFEEEGEERLVEALREGRQEVLGELYDAYAPALLGVILRIVENKAVAEEVLKETFMAIWSRIGVYDPAKTRFLTWGLAIARGLALHAQRTGKYKHLADAAKKDTFGSSKLGAPENLALHCPLEPRQKAVLELLYLQGLSCAQVAEQLQLSEAEVRTVLRMAFVQLGAEKS